MPNDHRDNPSGATGPKRPRASRLQGIIRALKRQVADRDERLETADESLRENEQRLRAILNTAVDAIITINARGIITGVNRATERMFGYSESQMLGQNVNMLMPSPDRERHDRYIANYLETGKARIIGIGREVLARRQNGTTFPIDLAVSEFADKAGPMFAGIIRDISSRKELEQHLMDARFEEQRRVAQELHDGLGGQMTGIGLLARTLQVNLERAGSSYASDAGELTRHIRDAHEQLRSISRGLSPVEVTPGGLIAALRELAERTNKAHELECVCGCRQTVAVYDADVATHLYRIAQEAVSNAVRHGKPSRITIGLDAEGDRVTLTISNNGRPFQGFADGGPGMGMRTMKYRADLIGASLSVAPLEGGGTIVTCSVTNKETQP